MKFTNMPNPVKKSLSAFLLFLIIILIGRHVVSDQRQEYRIELLETQLEQLQAQQDAYGKKLTEITVNTTTKDNPAAKAYSQKEPGSHNIYSGKKEHTAVANTTEKTSSKMEKLVEKLTEENKSQKFASPVLLELNTVDSATLIKVPGIASRTASTILAYRTKLGGFYSPEQLREKLTWDAAQDHMDEWCEKWMKADESLVQMLHINTLSFKELNRHPYISYEQTKAIVRYRDKHKSFHSMAELEQLGCFDEETLNKLKHYISFE